MTEPNVLGNVSPAKFLFDSGNTEIITLWRESWASAAVTSMYHKDAGTKDGQLYIVPASRVLYLLSFTVTWKQADLLMNIQSNASSNTSTGGTTLWKEKITDANNVGLHDNMCLKFVAGEYVTPYNEDGNQWHGWGWGVECDA